MMNGCVRIRTRNSLLGSDTLPLHTDRQRIFPLSSFHSASNLFLICACLPLCAPPIYCATLYSLYRQSTLIPFRTANDVQRDALRLSRLQTYGFEPLHGYLPLVRFPIYAGFANDGQGTLFTAPPYLLIYSSASYILLVIRSPRRVILYTSIYLTPSFSTPLPTQSSSCYCYMLTRIYRLSLTLQFCIRLLHYSPQH